MDIKTLPATLKSIVLINCKMLKNIRVICDLVNLEWLEIIRLPELEELPSFARSTSLRGFELTDCYRIEKIEGLENCTRLESLRLDTCWEVPGIESLEHMEKLRRLQLRANKGSAIERCIQTIKRWPDKIQICTRAVPNASSLVDSLLSPNLVLVDSFFNQKINSRPKLVKKNFSNGDAIMLCFVIKCVSPEINLFLKGPNGRFSQRITKFEKGRWIWIGVFTQASIYCKWYTAEVSISGSGGECTADDEVEKGLVVRGEEHRLEEAVRSILPLLQS